MAKNPNQKLKILYIMQMLTQETDEQHGLTMAQIIDKLDERGIKAERKSIYDDIALLRDFGLDIITRKTQITEYYIGSREFEYPELTLLVDAVQSSRFLTEKKSRALISKLETLASVHEAKLLKKQVYVAGRVKMQNESIFYNVDAIQQAIAMKRKISFQYFYYNIEKKRVPRYEGKVYLLTPVGLAYINEYYYLVTYSDKYESLANYRVDRMMNIKVSDEPVTPLPRELHFDLAEWCQTKFSMFGGEDMRVQLVFENDLIMPLMDHFGKDIRVQKEDEAHGRAFVAIAKSTTFFGWLAQFGDLIRIDAPEDLKAEYKAFLKKIEKLY
jgi:predicted DNA-binding transcriptional regulator YafY